MRRFGVLLIILATLTIAGAVRAEDWTLANGKVYKNVVIVAQEGDGVRVTYDGGVGKFPYYELSDDILLRIGQDPATQAIKRAAVRKQQAEDALKAQQDAAAAAELKKQQADAAAVDAALKATQGSVPAPAPNSATTPNGAPAPSGSSVPNSASTPNASPAPSPAPGQQPLPNAAQPGTNANANATPTPAPVAPPLPPGKQIAAPSTAEASGWTDQQQSIYPNSKFQYDESADLSYLDSPVINVEPVLAETTPPEPGTVAPISCIYLRIVTEGHRAESPDEVEGVFSTSVPIKSLTTNNKVVFLVDGAYIPTTPPLPTGDPSADAPSATQVNFFLTPEHMKALLAGKKVNVNVGGTDYRIDDAGIATFRAFLGDVDHLPPASTSVVRVWHRLIDRLPSIVTMISTVCEYIILGAFAIVMVGSIAAFVMGLTRFIKM